MISVSWNTASVIAGKIRWRQPSTVKRPLVQWPSATTSPRPKAGSQRRLAANTEISRIPIRKVGSDTPSSENVISTCEPKLPRRKAE